MSASELDLLLNLDGEIFPFDNGFWVKFEARRVESNKHLEHGIRYSLTRHDANNTRVLGFDNAHAILLKKKRKKFNARKTAWDHKHKMEMVSLYEFKSPGQILEDFWKEIYQILDK